MIVWLLLLAVDGVVAATDGQCHVTGSVINCKGKHLTTVPLFEISTNRTAVFLNYNAIEHVHAHAFVNISDTRELRIHLDHNNVNSLDMHSLEDLENVTVRLFLQQNNFTQGLPEAVTSLRQLTHLHVDGISTLAPDVLSNISRSLEYLSIGMDTFPQWPTELEKLQGLTTLEMSRVQFASIPTDAFSGFQSTLEFLYIVYSELSSTLTAICPLVNLQALSFTNTKVEDVSTLLPACSGGLNSTWLLKFQHVTFSTFPKVFQVFPRLTSLEVSNNNQLRFISEDAVPDHNELTHLILRNNKLRQVPFVVQKMASLKMLDLSGNVISVLEKNDLGRLSRLTVLILTSNPILEVSVHALSSLSSLHHLGLRQTNLTHVPLAILDVSPSAKIDLRSNRIPCDCTMDWMLNTHLMSSVMGTCIHTNQNQENIVDYVKSNCKTP